MENAHPHIYPENLVVGLIYMPHQGGGGREVETLDLIDEYREKNKNFARTFLDVTSILPWMSLQFYPG